jgi:hypothetical protein
MSDERGDVPPPTAQEPTSLLSSAQPTDPALLKAFEDNRLRANHYSAIGQVAALWSYFEAVVASWMITFANVEVEIGICFTAQILGSRGRIDGFIALVRHLGVEEKWGQILDTFAKKVQRLSEKRNRAVHDVWYLTEPASPRRHEVSASRLVRNLVIDMPTDDLLKLVKEINDLREEFDTIAEKLFTEVRPYRA